MTIHIYTCECGAVFRDQNSAMAFELWQQHRDESPRHNGYTVSAELHSDYVHTTTQSVVPPGTPWRPGDAP